MAKSTAHEDLVTKIRATRGFRVSKPTESGVQVTNTSTGRTCKVPLQLYGKTLDTCLNRLRGIGWTTETWRKDQEAKLASELEQAMKDEEAKQRILQEASAEEAEAVRATVGEIASGIVPELVAVTPKMAAAWLETVPEYQRNRDKALVRDFVSQMLRGEWRVIHQALGFDVNGKLLDGQHRMEAVKQSGTTQYFWVMRGLPEETYKYVDRGKKRTNADAFKGRKNADTLTKVLRVVYLWDSGVPQLEWRNHPKVSIDQLEATDAKHPLLEDHLPVALRMRKIGCSPIGAGFAFYRISQALGYDVTLPEAWFKKIYTGIGLYDGDPAAALKHYFEHTSKSADTRARLLSSKRTAADRDAYLLIEGWNKAVEGRTLQRFSPRLDTFVIGDPEVPRSGTDARYFGVLPNALPPGFDA